jgi:ion channel-forming bestrophin family protein
LIDILILNEMIITKKIILGRIIKGTWKGFIVLGLVCVLAYLFNEYILLHYIEFPTIVPGILGPALAFFIGFNNNQAYDRWWEARKIWGGLVNDSRTWARQIVEYSSTEDAQEDKELLKIKKKTIYRHIAFLYALKDNLRSESRKGYRKYLDAEETSAVEKESNIHNAILSFQSKDLEYIKNRNWIDGFKFIELNKMIVRFCDGMGMSERIKNTVFPTTYTYYTRLFIWLFIISMTFVFSDLVGVWSIFFGILVGYIYIVMHTIGLAILNPFEPVPSGISLDQITRTIEINLLETLKESDIPEPIKSTNGEYIM